MPCGVITAPPMNALLNQRTFGPPMAIDVEIFFDDCGVGSGSFEDHMSKLEKCFQCYKMAGMTLNSTKCSFLQSSVVFLGHRASSKGLQHNPGKIDKIRTWEWPTDTSNVQRFVWFVNYYRWFINGFARQAQPLRALTHQGAGFQWGPQQRSISRCSSHPDDVSSDDCAPYLQGLSVAY